MVIKLECSDYGFECDFVLEGEASTTNIEKLREHFEVEHGIEYSPEFVMQMITNKGHSRDSITSD